MDIKMIYYKLNNTIINVGEWEFLYIGDNTTPINPIPIGAEKLDGSIIMSDDGKYIENIIE